MIPESFAYHRPPTLDAAIRLLSEHGGDAKILAGGHSLIPAMKLRLARPKVLIDLARVPDLTRIEADGEHVVIGAMATHAAIAASDVLRRRCPLLPETAVHIGDLQVRNKGTIGGSLAHADPAADWPAAVLALDAQIEAAGPTGRRWVPADAFFEGLLQTALRPDEVLCRIRIKATGDPAAYVKTEQKASGFALCGVAAVVSRAAGGTRIGITGVSTTPFRARAAEALLAGASFDGAVLRSASAAAGSGIDALSDIHASAEYRLHLAAVNTRRALERALARR